MNRGPWRALITACLVVAGVSFAAAQEFRATVTGQVLDESGGALPGVTVTVSNTETNEVAVVVTTGVGVYSVAFLKPGIYTVTAQLEGFKTYRRERLELEVGQTATVNIVLQLGALAETVEVVGEAIDATKADRGNVIDNERVTEIPLNARNPFYLSTLAAGITYNGNAIYQRPFDNGAIADWSVNGGQNRNNEFLLDGAPNNAIQGGNNIAYVPPVDAVQEFKIITNSYDAQYGRTGGGIINVSLKSGTNALRGTVYEFYRRKWLDSNSFLLNLQGQPKPDHKLDQYGFEVDGPLVKNRTFVMFNYEGYKESTAEPSFQTFPDANLRNGDFSNYRDQFGRLIVIYDPKTGRNENGRWVRDPFLGNTIPADRINPVARALLRYYPMPNTSPPPGTAPWQDNFFTGANLARDDFYNFATKVDHVFSDRTKMFVRYGQNNRQEMRHTNGIVDGPAQVGPLPLERINHTGVFDWVHTSRRSFVLNIRSGLNQYVEGNRVNAALGFDESLLGFPSSLVSQLPSKTFPRVDISGFARLGNGTSTRDTTTVYSLQPSFAATTGRHSLRGGLDARLTWNTREDTGYGGMRLRFDDRFTRSDYRQGDPLSGSGLASFLLGLPYGDPIDNNVLPTFRWSYYAPWVQDDWRLGNRLTINLGLRWDFNSPVWEKENRLDYTFDPSVVNPADERIDHSDFPQPVLGVRQFVGTDSTPSKYAWDWDLRAIQPRVGAAYMLTDRTVLRGGYGRYYLNPTTTGNEDGFSITTPLIGSLDGNRTAASDLSNPFPSGVAQPPGSSAGADFGLGRGFTFPNPTFRLPHVDQFSIGIQRYLPWRTSVDISYVGSRTRAEQSDWNGYNEPPIELRNQCNPTLGGSPDFCDERLPNPFFGVAGFEGTGHFTSPTRSRFDLNRPYPQFGGITEAERNDGMIWYNSLQVVVNKRLSDGLTLNGTYTRSKTIEQVGWLDNVAMTPQKGFTSVDRPHRVTLSGVYRLPFGRGRARLPKVPELLDVLVSGWEVAGAYIFNSGRPWSDQPDTFIVNDGRLDELDYSGGVIRAVRPCTGRMDNSGQITLLAPGVAAGCTEAFYISRPSYTHRTVPVRSDTIRRPSFHQFDMNFAKTTRLSGNTRVQFRIEVFNVLNVPMYDERNYSTDVNSRFFGAINRQTTGQSNFPRQVQLGLKLLW